MNSSITCSQQYTRFHGHMGLRLQTAGNSLCKSTYAQRWSCGEAFAPNLHIQITRDNFQRDFLMMAKG